MTRQFFHLAVAAALMFAAATASLGAITVRQISAGRTESASVPSITQNSVLCAALPLFLESLGFAWHWDPAGRQLTCSRNAAQFVFTEDVLLYRYGPDLYPLGAPPRRIGASLFIPVDELCEIGRRFDGNSCSWDAALRVLTIQKPVNKAPFTITSVNAEKKQNGVLVTIELADSVPFDFTYYYPNVTLSFFGATVDTAAVKSRERLFILDSVFSIQYKESAQVSLLVTREIEEPQIDYVQDLRTVLISLRPRQERPDKPAPEGAENQAVAPGIRTIVIDPGHGGRDPGAIGPGGVREKDVVLSIALQVRDQLEKKRGIRVHCTRETDMFIPLIERTRMANARNADLLISIHANAISGNAKKKETTRGYKVYFLSQAKNEEDKLAAMRENSVIELEEKPQNYTELQNVLTDLAGNEYLRESQDICILLDQSFYSRLGAKISRQARGIGQANFWVLNGAYMPSILIETGFISNMREERLLTDKRFQKDMAASIANAVLNFIKKYENQP